MAEVIVDDLQIQDALINGLADNRALKEATVQFIDDTATLWRKVWETSVSGVEGARKNPLASGGDPHPYETGDYVEHIKKIHIERIDEKMIRQALVDGALLGSVYNDSDVAEFVEDGTKKDKPGSKSPWGPNTPTPAFKVAERTAELMQEGFSG